jgi:hypothetical protein
VTGPSATDSMLATLHAPERNKYFYGKLLDVRHFQLEQCYGLEKRWLLNRLTLGFGVLCGLTVTTGADGTLGIGPGVAIDTLGREVIVPAPVVVDPAQPTDAWGIAAGAKLTSGPSTIYLCYNECDSDPTLVSIADCDGTPSTAAGSTVERYRVLVTAGLPAAKPAALTDAQRNSIFPGVPPTGFDRLVAAEQSLAINCAIPPEPTCVVLATVTLASDGVAFALDQYAYRSEVFSNTVLFELIAGLAERVDACCAAMHPVVPPALTITDGDAQSGDVSTVLAAPVHLLVADTGAVPAAGQQVVVTTGDAGAGVSLDGVAFASTVTATTGADGVVTVHWQLGSSDGAQTFTATLTSSGAAVTLQATATAVAVPPPPPPPPAALAPVVRRIDPRNASAVPVSWAREPPLVVAFDQPMSSSSLNDPDPWLRAWHYQDFGNGEFGLAQRIRLTFQRAPDDLSGAYTAEPIDSEGFKVVVMMLGSAPEIIAADAAGLALDAEFTGTKLTQDQLDQLWGEDEFRPDRDFGDRVVDSGAQLPSGDGTPGGKYFSSFFTVSTQ